MCTWPCTVWPPKHTSWMKKAAQDITSGSAERPHRMKVAINNFAPQSLKVPCWMKVAILRFCLSKCRNALLGESGHSEIPPIKVQKCLVGWKWPLTTATWNCISKSPLVIILGFCPPRNAIHHILVYLVKASFCKHADIKDVFRAFVVTLSLPTVPVVHQKFQAWKPVIHY